ncbi:hypothetical protein [Streptomyces sp. ISL-94]|nr:hypothetical protein [Streptomyces sp. ISL-94]
MPVLLARRKQDRELGIVPDAYEPHLHVDFTKLRSGFDEAA